MSKFISKTSWDRYSKIIHDFVDQDAGLQEFIWLRIKNGNTRYVLPQLHGEDAPHIFDPIKLKGLFHYNYVRTWPYNLYTPSGALDNTNMVLYITKKQLEDNNYLDQYGRWDFDNISDRFIVKGQVYKPAGDTPVAQASDDNLLFFIVLQIEDLEETKKIIEEYHSFI